jgi:hypothetical protein
VPNVKTEGTIKNEPSRDTGNIGHKTQATLGTRHRQHWAQDTDRRQTNKKNSTQKNKKMSNTDPNKNKVDPCDLEG